VLRLRRIRFHFFAFSPNSTSWDFKGAGIKATQNQRTGAFELKAGHNSKSRPGVTGRLVTAIAGSWPVPLLDFGEAVKTRGLRAGL